MIWIVNAGEFVTETDEMTDSTRTDVFMQFTSRAGSIEIRDDYRQHVPNVTALTLPLIITTDCLQLNKLMDWLS